MRGTQIGLNGQNFFYRSWGPADGPVILMLHGFPEYSGAWEELAAQLPHHHIIAPDQRGYGQSWAPTAVAEYATSKLVGDMAALIGALGLGPVTVLGHDWGSAVAYGLAMFHPELVKHLIVMNGVHPAPFQQALAAGGAQTAASQYINWLRAEGTEARLQDNNFARLRGLFSAHMDMAWLDGQKLQAYQHEWARPGRLRGMLNWYRASPLVVAKPGTPVTDLPALPRDRLQVRAPHLLVWGENDTALLPEATDGLEAFCTDLTRRSIAGADHWLHHQKPAEVAHEITRWLAQHP